MPTVTWTRTTTTEDRSTGVVTTSTSTITGEAIKVRGEPQRYRALGLVESEAPTLLFAPATYGDRIKPGDRTTFRSQVFTARECHHLEPDGVVIQTRVIVER